MPAYLLDTQALADVARNENTPVNSWASDQDPSVDEVVASAVSFTLLKHEVESLESERRAPWQRMLSVTLERFRSFDAILPVDVPESSV